MISIGHMIEPMDISFPAKHHNKRVIPNGMDEILHFLYEHGEENLNNFVNESEKVIRTV